MVRDCVGLRGSGLSPQLLPRAMGSQCEPEDEGENEQWNKRTKVQGQCWEVTSCRKMTLFCNNLLTFVNTAVTARMYCVN